MGLQRFDLNTMNALDGGITPAMFQDAVRRAVKDCIERPGDKRARVVTLQMKIVPVPLISGNTIDCEGARHIPVQDENPGLRNPRSGFRRPKLRRSAVQSG